MARIRTIKPDFFLDTELSELPIEARYFFIGLWTQADREGRLEDNPKRLKAQIFPWDPIDPELLLAALSSKFILRYEVGGRRYIQIVAFAKHQRPHPREAESTIPAHQGLPKAQPRHCLSNAKDLPRQVDKGNGLWILDKGCMEPEGFEAFWSAYPRHVSKKDALKAFCKIGPDTALLSAMLLALEKQKASHDWQKDDGAYVPYPAKWLNGRRWEDEVGSTSSVSNECDDIESQKRSTAAKIASRMVDHANV